MYLCRAGFRLQRQWIHVKAIVGTDDNPCGVCRPRRLCRRRSDQLRAALKRTNRSRRALPDIGGRRAFQLRRSSPSPTRSATTHARSPASPRRSCRISICGGTFTAGSFFLEQYSSNTTIPTLGPVTTKVDLAGGDFTRYTGFQLGTYIIQYLAPSGSLPGHTPNREQPASSHCGTGTFLDAAPDYADRPQRLKHHQRALHRKTSNVSIV